MKSIISYINENQQIVEAFECDILKRADESIKNLIKIRKDYYLTTEKDLRYFGKLPSMKDLLRYSVNAQYDKITNDMVQSYKGGDANAIKQIRKIFKEDSPENVIAIGFLNGNIYCFANALGTVYVYPANITTSRTYTLNYNDKQYQKLEPFKQADELYIITIDSALRQDANNIRNKRFLDKQGMIFQGDAHFYNELAKANRERYKKIIAQNKALFTDDSDLLEKYENVMQRVVRLSTTIAAQPDKITNSFYSYTTLMHQVYETRHYDRNGKHTGTDGLLTTFLSYTDTKRDVLKDGGYEFQQRELVMYRNNLKKILDDVEKRIDALENEI